MKSKADVVDCFWGIQPHRLVCFSRRARGGRSGANPMVRPERRISMLSTDELHDGMHFILKLRNAAGVTSQWMEKLRDDVARHWYDIYRSSDWEALRTEASGVFCHSVSDAHMWDFLKTGTRCIFIDPPLVKVEDLRIGTVFEPS